LRIVVDLDGTICKIKQKNQSYDQLEPIPDAAKKLKELHDKGHYIIITTARHMATCESNTGKLMKKIGKITLEWLDKYNIPYDEIYFGRPNGEVYIDDRAVRFTSWKKIDENYLKDNARER